MSNVIVKIAKIVQNARPILAKACYIIAECCLSSGESTYSLFQALRKWGRREKSACLRFLNSADPTISEPGIG